MQRHTRGGISQRGTQSLRVISPAYRELPAGKSKTSTKLRLFQEAVQIIQAVCSPDGPAFLERLLGIRVQVDSRKNGRNKRIDGVAIEEPSVSGRLKPGFRNPSRLAFPKP